MLFHYTLRDRIGKGGGEGKLNYLMSYFDPLWITAKCNTTVR